MLNSLSHLRDIGNTLIIVEHDQETIETADWVLDIGPGAGLLGGQVVAQGTPAQIRRSKTSLTGKFLSGKEKIEIPSKRRTPKSTGNKWISVRKAAENNLAGITVKIPLACLLRLPGFPVPENPPSQTRSSILRWCESCTAAPLKWASTGASGGWTTWTR